MILSVISIGSITGPINLYDFLRYRNCEVNHIPGVVPSCTKRYGNCCGTGIFSRNAPVFINGCHIFVTGRKSNASGVNILLVRNIIGSAILNGC